MARTAAVFKQSDVKRAIAAAQGAGLQISGVEISPDGRIFVHTAGGNENTADAALEAWERGRRHAG